MSRIGRKILPLPKGVTLAQKPGSVSVKGPKGELTKAVPTGVTIKAEADKITVLRADDERVNRAKHGLMRAHLANMQVRLPVRVFLEIFSNVLREQDVSGIAAVHGL